MLQNQMESHKSIDYSNGEYFASSNNALGCKKNIFAESCRKDTERIYSTHNVG